MLTAEFRERERESVSEREPDKKEGMVFYCKNRSVGLVSLDQIVVGPDKFGPPGCGSY